MSYLAKNTEHLPFPGISSMSTTAELPTGGAIALSGTRPPKGIIELKPVIPNPAPRLLPVKFPRLAWFIRSSFSVKVDTLLCCLSFDNLVYQFN